MDLYRYTGDNKYRIKGQVCMPGTGTADLKGKNDAGVNT
jgi:hypothetical protein